MAPKAALTTLALSVFSAPFIDIALANPTVTIVESTLPTPLAPFHEYTCGDPTLPTAYYFFNIHYDSDVAGRNIDQYALPYADPRREEVAEKGKKIADDMEKARTCQEQIYLTLEQLTEQGKISVGFAEGLQRGVQAEYSTTDKEYNARDREDFLRV